jgi:hypothetical protein
MLAMGKFPDTELSRRLRANWGRRLQPDFIQLIARTLGYWPKDRDFLGPRESDELFRTWEKHWSWDTPPTTTRPHSEPSAFSRDLGEVADRLGPDHRSYLVLFRDWEHLGALRVRSADLLSRGAFVFSDLGETLALLTNNPEEFALLDYTGPDQLDDGEECVQALDCGRIRGRPLSMAHLSGWVRFASTTSCKQSNRPKAQGLPSCPQHFRSAHDQSPTLLKAEWPPTPAEGILQSNPRSGHR